MINFKKFLLPISICLYTLCSSVAVAQSCLHMQGQWYGNYPQIWNLNSSGNGTVIVTCGTSYPRTWPVYGSISNGSVSLTAVDPYNLPECSGIFTYSGTLREGGCNIADGTWTNPHTSGSFLMNKSCEVPSSEITLLGSWGLTKHEFDAIVSNASGPNLSGRLYRETDYATGVDTCWYPGSPFPKFDGTTALYPFTLASDNKYQDNIGRSAATISHYRSAGHTPCSSTIYQQMQIACGTTSFGSLTWQPVQNNVITVETGNSTITITRDGVQAGPINY